MHTLTRMQPPHTRTHLVHGNLRGARLKLSIQVILNEVEELDDALLDVDGAVDDLDALLGVHGQALAALLDQAGQALHLQGRGGGVG